VPLSRNRKASAKSGRGAASSCYVGHTSPSTSWRIILHHRVCDVPCRCRHEARSTNGTTCVWQRRPSYKAGISNLVLSCMGFVNHVDLWSKGKATGSSAAIRGFVCLELEADYLDICRLLCTMLFSSFITPCLKSGSIPRSYPADITRL